MFLFGKKKESAPKALSPQEQQVQDFAQQFYPEEFVILALTGGEGFTGDEPEGGLLRTAGIGLTAWLEDGEEEVHQEDCRLVTLADERLFGYLRSHIPRDFILKVRVRESREGNLFQMVGMPEPGFDPDLKALLDEQKKGVTMDGGALGTFMLIRGTGYLEADADWNGQPVRLDVNQEDDFDACLATAGALFDSAEEWDARVRSFVADHMLEQAKIWDQESEAEEESEPLTRESFMARLVPDCIQASPDGAVQFWLVDGDMFTGRTIHVTGTLSDGPVSAMLLV